MNPALRYPLGLIFAPALCLAGCTGSGPETVPVYGKIIFAGREMPRICRLYFHHTETASISRPAVATANTDGSYEVKSFQHSQGIIPGTYRVKVTYFDLKPGANPDVGSNWIESAYDAGELAVEASSGGVEHNIEVPRKS